MLKELAEMTPQGRVGRRRRVSAAILVSAAVVAALSCSALVGFLCDLPLWTGLGSSLLPMAPSTAALLLVHAVVLVLSTRHPPGGWRDRVATVLVRLVALVSATLLVLSFFGIRTRLEHLGMHISGEVRGIPVGYMSPVTAIAFLLASMAASPSLPDAHGRRWRNLLGIVAAATLLLSSLVFLLAYLYGRPLMHQGGFIPPAMNTSLAFAALGAGLLLKMIAAQGPGLEAAEPRKPRIRLPFLLGYLLFAVGIVVAGSHYQWGFEAQYRSKVESELHAISDIKVSELGLWRRERVGDGEVFLGNSAFSGLVQRAIVSPADGASREEIATWLGRVRESYQYERAFIVDPEGRELAAFPPGTEMPARHLRDALPELLRSRRVALLDFHREEESRAIRLAVVAPLYSPGDGRDLGAVVLRVDPATGLYPIIQRWPTASETAETLLVRRDEDHVLFLNELRFRKDAALSLRVPLRQESMPAVKAALGHTGMVEGVDYRGHEVIAYVQPVPGTAWSLVARTDTAEVYGPLTDRLWLMVMLISALLLASGSALGLAWRHQSARFYRERYLAGRALRASQQQLEERNEELTRFTYAVSHDLKSPLVTIQTFAGYLEQDLAQRDEATIQKDLGFIRSAADKMARLLEELLSLSRVGRVKNPEEDAALQEVVREALGLVAGRIAARGVQVELTDEPINVHGDRVRLVEVFQNLIDNAAKFMGDQTAPRVEIGAEESAGETVFFVRDNGMGVDARHLPKLFGLFEKLNPKTEGTGMGLALVRRIIELHGGRIWAESGGPGQGCCFRFTLAGTRRGGQ